MTKSSVEVMREPWSKSHTFSRLHVRPREARFVPPLHPMLLRFEPSEDRRSFLGHPKLTSFAHSPTTQLPTHYAEASAAQADVVSTSKSLLI
jgi:hypothetical protein